MDSSTGGVMDETIYLSEKWKVKSEKWRVKSEDSILLRLCVTARGIKSGEWRIKSEKWKVKSEKWRVKSEEKRMKNEKWIFLWNYIMLIYRLINIDKA